MNNRQAITKAMCAEANGHTLSSLAARGHARNDGERACASCNRVSHGLLCRSCRLDYEVGKPVITQAISQVGRQR